MSDAEIRTLSRSLDRTSEGLEAFMRIGIEIYGESNLMHCFLAIIAAHDSFKHMSGKDFVKQVHLERIDRDVHVGATKATIVYLDEGLRKQK